jgi:hypothetical protein
VYFVTFFSGGAMNSQNPVNFDALKESVRLIGDGHYDFGQVDLHQFQGKKKLLSWKTN